MAKPTGLNIRQATGLVRTVCDIAGSRDLIEGARAFLIETGIVKAVQIHDTGALFGWLLEAVSYQGVSDAAAQSYMDAHGVVTSQQLARMFRQQPNCPKLQSYWHFTGCGFRKLAATCNRPELFNHCPVPRHDLRNGSLNQAAYSLYLFMRDIADGDFVRWIDTQLTRATSNSGSLSESRAGEALIEPLRHIHGLSFKVLNMSLAALLLGADSSRTAWIDAGAGLVAIDTLVHNWLHRSGILSGLGAEHLYGPNCYSEDSCADIVRRISRRIDARHYGEGYPEIFPRFVQHAVWRFCAQQQLNQCNGVNINDAGRCKLEDCILFERCARVKLGRSSPVRPAASAK